MKNKKLSGISRLANKVGAICGAALALLATDKANASGIVPAASHAEGNRIVAGQSVAKKKPVAVLKLNPSFPGQSLFVAQHRSHSSHSSHRSHASHRSHYSRHS